MKRIPLSDKLELIEVPKDRPRNFVIYNRAYPDKGSVKVLHYDFQGNGEKTIIIGKSEDDFKIHGLIILPDFTMEFEVLESFVEKVMDSQHYQNYDFKSVTDRWVKTKDQSFQSLVKQKIKETGFYTENPYECPTPIIDYTGHTLGSTGVILNADEIIRYEESESKVISGNLLLLERTNNSKI